MCGIAGVLGTAEAQGRELVEQMAAQMVHRGPDGAGFFAADGIALGVRRLAIIDPEHGDQPIFNEQRDIAVVFNGELYNHAELRKRLSARGHSFRSGSDGEVLPHLYEEQGEGFVELLNGIFAIALWDGRARELRLFRDRFGVKPLYWTGNREQLRFSSELKALMAAEGVPRMLDHSAVDAFLTYRFVPSPRTLLAAVKKLPPAGVLTVGPDGVREGRYWDGAEDATGVRRDRRRLVLEYQEAFERAVVRQTMSDRPIGVMLSGGVDSGAITAVLAKHSPHVRTYTVGFAEGGDANEIALAEETARRFGTEHQSLIISSDEYRRRLPESLVMIEEPVGSTSALAVLFVAELMRPDVPVALSGQGADEPLAGYRRHLGVKIAERLQPLAPLLGLGAHVPGVARNVRIRRAVASLGQSTPIDRLMAAYTVFGRGLKSRLYRAELREQLDGLRAEIPVEALLAESIAPDLLGRMLYVDTRLWLPDELLLIADKMSMAASVELRVPFLDQDLIALVESMHSSQKLRGFSRKSIHKRAMLKWLPPQVVYRKERGWATPMDRWLRNELRPMLEDVVLDPGGICREIFEEAELRRLVEVHATRREDRTRELFCLLSLGLWYRAFGTSR
jgi:asparagine synthase (glutamine-hydrolysing)